MKPAVTLCDGISLRVPIVQAVLSSCDGPALASEVSRAGALGTLSVPATEPGRLKRQLARIRQRTSRPVLLAFTAPFERESVLETALEMGFRHFQVFWWNAPRLAPRIQRAGGTVFYQVGTREQAEDALTMGANVLVAPGTEAGGQVRTPLPAHELLAQLLALPDCPPVVAGGGLATRRDVEAILKAGATAALLGTRFLLSQESRAPRNHKRRLLREADSNRLYLDPALVGDWPCAPRRRLPLSSGLDAPSLFAGQGLGRMGRILPAGEIVRRLSS